ncbi:hypothetical protein NUSPORA_01674 [Nucleospora cyclopteri]
MNIEKLFKHFNVEFNKSVPKPQVKKKKIYHESTEEFDLFWSEDLLPATEFTKDRSMKNRVKVEEIRSSIVSLKKFLKTCHTLDIELINNINASDLISYNGFNPTQNVKYIQNKNAGLLKYFNTLKYKDIKKMLKHSELLKNYNLMNLLVQSFQTHSLSSRRIEKLKFYKEMLKKQDFGIIPMEWMLKDCADSNMNVESEVASIRFCKIIEKLNEMQSITLDYNVKEKDKHYVYTLIYQNIDNISYEVVKEDIDYKNLYLNL